MNSTAFIYEGRRFKLYHHGDHIGKKIAATKTFYEIALLRFIKDTAPHGGLYIDVGANIGNHSVFFAAFCAERVLALEPIKENIFLALPNLTKRQNPLLAFVKLMQVGAGRTHERLGATVKKDNMGMCNLGGEGDIQVITIDSLLGTDISYDTKTPVSLIKIDCEGMEMDVLAGAQHVIDLHRPHLVVEAQDDKAFAELNKWVALNRYVVTGKFCATPTYYLSPIK